MCGRYTFTQTPNPDLIVLPEEGFKTLTPNYNVAPGQLCPVIPQDDPKSIHLFQWGLIPYWAKDEKMGFKMINARSETVATKPAFRDPIRRSRCLVWADGFYEWKKDISGKQPFRITLKTGNPFFFAGISDRWRSPEGKIIETFSVLTTEPNELMMDIHDRMPVIFTESEKNQWLDPTLSTDSVLSLLRPFDASLMEAYPVSPSVGNVRNNSANLVERFVPPPTLFG